MAPKPRSSRGAAQNAEAEQQKKILLGLIALCGLLILGAVAWFLMGKLGGSGDTDHSGSETSSAEATSADGEEVQIDGLGDNWDKRLADAEASVERIKQLPAEDPSIAEDAVYTRFMGKAMADLREAQTESVGGDPVLARKAVAAVVESEEKLNQYLEARESLGEIVAKFEEARKMAAEFRLQSFQSERYKEALALRQEAEKATAEGDAEAASAAYEAGIARLNEGKQRFDKTIEDARSAAAEAIQAGDKAAAEESARAILERLPGDEEGEIIRVRAVVLDQTHPLFVKAQAAEAKQLFSVAEGLYRKIIELDEHHDAARERLEQVVAARSEIVMLERLGQAEAASANGALEDALEYVDQALALVPGDQRALTLEADIQKRYDRIRIGESLAKAAAFEKAGAWSEAMKLYSELSADFPGLKQASEGLERSREGLKAKLEAEKLVEAAREGFEATSIADLEYAITLLERARRIDPNNKSAVALLEASQERLKLMSAPIPVTLVSDGATKVEVWKVGVYQNVTEQTIELKPGSYTVVGKKAYYFDVKLDLSVKPGSEPIRFKVICNKAL